MGKSAFILPSAHPVPRQSSPLLGTARPQATATLRSLQPELKKSQAVPCLRAAGLRMRGRELGEKAGPGPWRGRRKMGKKMSKGWLGGKERCRGA